MPDINMQVFEEAKRNQLVTEVDIQTQAALDNYQVKLSDITNPTQSQDNVVIDRFGGFLPHWNESLDFDTWIKMSMEIAGKRILMLQGNSSISNESSIDRMSEFGDEFLTGTLDATKWDTSDKQGTITESSGQLHITHSTASWFTSKDAIMPDDFRIIARGKSNTNYIGLWGHCDGAGDPYGETNDISGLMSVSGNYVNLRYDEVDHTDSQAYSAGTIYIVEFIKVGSNLTINTYDSSYNLIQTHEGTVSNLPTGRYFSFRGYNSTQDYDYIYITKTVAVEPTWLANDIPQNIAVALKSLGRAG